MKRWKEAQKEEKKGTVGLRTARAQNLERYGKYLEFVNEYFHAGFSDRILDIGSK